MLLIEENGLYLTKRGSQNITSQKNLFFSGSVTQPGYTAYITLHEKYHSLAKKFKIPKIKGALLLK